MGETKTAPDATGKPRSVEAFRERLLNERHLFTNRMLEAGAWVISNQRVIALETLSVMAEKSQLTPSIFVRLAKAMGFDGFSDMQKLFRAPLHESYPASLSERISHSLGDEVVQDPGDVRAIGRSFCRANSASLAHLGGRLDELPISTAIDLILAARTVHVIGLDRSFPIAAYFAYALRRANVQTIQITGMGSLAAEQVATMRPGDLLISISFPPYAQNTIDTHTAARVAGRDIIAITDTPVSPVTEGAVTVLTVDDAELHGFRSLTAVMTLVQTIAIGLAYRLRGVGDLDLDLDLINA